jgi:hypothetical protein
MMLTASEIELLPTLPFLALNQNTVGYRKEDVDASR